MELACLSESKARRGYSQMRIIINLISVIFGFFSSPAGRGRAKPAGSRPPVASA